MTHETSPFDSAEDKAEWEETHFGEENEDEAYDRERQRELDEHRCAATDAFDDWFNSAVGPEHTTKYLDAMHVIRSAFFAGASYGIDETSKLHRRFYK